MDWWGVSATFFGAASFFAITWQVIRFEIARPALGWNLSLSMPGEVIDGKRTVRVAFRPSGPIVLHDVKACDWGAASVLYVTERARMDCDSDRLEADATWLVGHEAYVGFSWLEPSLIRPTPVRHAIRRRISDGQIQVWKWFWVPRPAKLRQGKWTAWKPRQKRRTFVPDMWGMPGSK